MKFRDTQNRIVERAVTQATAEVPMRAALQDAAQASDTDTGALPVVETRALRVLRCGTVPLNEGYLSSDADE